MRIRHAHYPLVRSGRLVAGLLLACLLARDAAAQATLIPPEYCAYSTNGAPLVGGTLTSYVAGTTTPLALYTDFALTTPHSNPLTLDGRGCVVAYMQPASYRFVLRDGDGTQVYDVTIVSSPALHTVNLDISATAGETLAAGALVFLADGSDSTTAGRWHLTDADTVSKSSGARIVGVTLAAIASGSTGSVRVQGRVTGLSGLTAGAPYYASATAGAFAATPPTNRRFVGAAESSSTFVLATGIVEAAAPTLLTLAVAGNTTVGGTLGVTGAVTGGTYNGQTISSAANFTGTLGVAGAATFSGRVGVGSSPSASIGAGNLQVTGGVLSAAGSSAAYTGNLYFDNTDARWEYFGNGYGIALQENGSGGYTFYTAPNNASGAGAAATLTSRFAIGNTGAVTVPGTLGVTGATTLSGVATVDAANNRGLVITRPSADAGLTVTSTGGSGLAYALTSTSAGELRLQHDADGDPRLALFGSSGSAELVGTGEFTFNSFASGVANTTYYQSADAQPGFIARNSADDTGLFSGTTVDLDDEVSDPGSDFASDTFTAPVTGVYASYGAVRVLNSSGGTITSLAAHLVLNGSSTFYPTGGVGSLATNERASLPLSALLSLTAGDTVTVRVTATAVGASGFTVEGGSSGTFETHWGMRLIP